MKILLRFFAVLVCVGLSQTVSAAPTRVLFVGNSYTAFGGEYSLEQCYAKLVQEKISDDVVVKKYTVGGASLELHLESARNGALKDLLSEGWDVVVLQDQSQIPGFAKHNAQWRSSRDAAVELAGLIDAAGAKTRLFMTWGRRAGDANNRVRYPDYESMQERLAEGYAAYADAIEAAGFEVQVVGVGEAWRSIHELSAEEGDPLAEDALFSRLYLGDGSHPSVLGTYLAAASFLAVLTGETPIGLNWAQDGVGEGEKLALQEAAARLLPPVVEPESGVLDTGNDSDANRSSTPAEETLEACGCAMVSSDGPHTWWVGLIVMGSLVLRRRFSAPPA